MVTAWGGLAAEPGPALGDAPGSAQILRWVEELNSDRFLEREVATEKLIAAGAAAVPPLVEALAGNNLEVTTRGIYILQELALSGDVAAEEAARQALEKAAEPRFTTAARRAAESLARLTTIRQERALEELKRLGATVGGEATEFGLQLVERYSLVFGDKWRGTDQDLTRLRWLRDVGELVFDGPRMTDECLKHLAGVQGLSGLTIRRASVSDDGVKSLTHLRGLQVLSLLYVPIGDRALADLKQLQGIGTLRIYGTNLSPTAAQQLQESLMATKVDFRSGAFLGIGCQPGAQGCVIYLVRPNSAAERAGLMANDILYEYEGQPVRDFETLTALISKNRAGETVTVKLIRGEERLTKKVVLGEWEK